MPKKIQIVTKDAKLEGFSLVGNQVIAEIPIPDDYAGRLENLFRIVDRFDGDEGATDGDIDCEAAIRARVPKQLRFVENLTGKTIDLDLDLEVKIV